MKPRNAYGVPLDFGKKHTVESLVTRKGNGIAPADWRNQLSRDKDGKITKTLANFSVCLTQHPAWRGVLAFNQFSRCITLKDAPSGVPSGLLDDHTVLCIRCWLEGNFLVGAREMVRDAIEHAAHAHAYHPIHDYLWSLKWDGKLRLGGFFPKYFGANQGSDRYLEAVGRMFLVSAIARVFQPGCQVDHVLVLEGAQGISKSKALRVLFGSEFFTDQMPRLDDKDSSLQLRGVWCVEFAEFDRLSRHDSSTVKSFLTRRVDKYREPYGRYPIDVPRQCVFAATVNLSEYLVDDANRRIWPVHCTTIDVDALARDRDQLWAEAFTLQLQGAPWWPQDDLQGELEGNRKNAKLRTL